MPMSMFLFRRKIQFEWSARVMRWLIQAIEQCHAKLRCSTPHVPNYKLLCYVFLRYIVFAIYLDIGYVKIHDKNYVFRKVRTTYNLECREY